MVGLETTSMNRRQRLWRNGWLFALVALLIVLTTVTVLTSVRGTSKLGSQQIQISSLEGQLGEAQAKNSEKVEADVLSALGFSRTRMNRDAPILADLARTVFTWDSGESYAQARTDLKTRFGLTDQDPFLADFMPPPRYRTDAGGARRYEIDVRGMNSSMNGSPSIDIVTANAGDYRYAIIATLAVTSDAVQQNNANKGQYSTSRKALLLVTVDSTGAVTKVSGIPASGSTRYSN